jgi:hypothetical protein
VVELASLKTGKSEGEILMPQAATNRSVAKHVTLTDPLITEAIAACIPDFLCTIDLISHSRLNGSLLLTWIRLRQGESSAHTGRSFLLLDFVGGDPSVTATERNQLHVLKEKRSSSALARRFERNVIGLKTADRVALSGPHRVIQVQC